MHHWNDSWFCGPQSFFGGPWGGLMTLGFWLLFALVIIGLVKGFWSSPHRSVPNGPPSPLEILKRRYATGEIDREEFERCRNDLNC